MRTERRNRHYGNRIRHVHYTLNEDGVMTMQSVADRAMELFELEPGKEITATRLAADLHCSYSTARTALKRAFDKGKLKRRATAHGEFYYWKASR